MLKRHPLRRAARAALFSFALATTAVSTGAAVAQEPPSQGKPAPDSATAFEAAGDGEGLKEKLPAWPFLYGAYFAILALLMLYVTTLWMRQRRIDQEITRLDAKLDRIDATLSAGGSRGD